MLPVERWHAAIFKRRSTRVYNGLPPGPEEMSALEAACREFRPSACVRAVLVPETKYNIFTGFLGYGVITGAVSYIALVGLMKDPRVFEMTGYLGEGIILEATALGLATCWVGGFYNPRVVAAEVRLATGEKVLAVSPVGYAPDREHLQDRVMRGLARGDRRKPLWEITTGLPEQEWPHWVKAGLLAARLAPSATNRQPWRFHVTGEVVTLWAAGIDPYPRVPKRLDCGIAMLHFELGAAAAGVKLVTEHLTPPAVARFWPETGQ